MIPHEAEELLPIKLRQNFSYTFDTTSGDLICLKRTTAFCGKLNFRNTLLAKLSYNTK